jgi:CBS domain-containing protein
MEITMNVKEIMTSPALTLAPETPIETAAARLFRLRLVAMPVVENGALIGIVGEADLYRAVAASRGVPLGGTVPFDELGRPRVVSDVMRRNVLWVKATDTVRLAVQLLMRHARSLPVLDRGRVVGMVTRRDVIAAIACPETINLNDRAMEPTGARYRIRGSHNLVDPDWRSRTTVDGWATNATDVASEVSRRNAYVASD